MDIGASFRTDQQGSFEQQLEVRIHPATNPNSKLRRAYLRMSSKTQDTAHVAVERPWCNAWEVWTKHNVTFEATKPTPVQKWLSEDPRDPPWNDVVAIKVSNQATPARLQAPAIIHDSDRATQGSHGAGDH